MSTVASPRPLPAAVPPPSRLARALARLAGWLELYSQTALRIARVGTVAGAALAAGVSAFNVFTRYVLGYSLVGADELARYAFVWTIWMGVALAVRSGAAMAITILVNHGPAWWRRALRTFSGAALAALLLFACYRATQYAISPESLSDTAPALGMRKFYGIAPMAVGLYFVALFYLQEAVVGAARLVAAGRTGARAALEGLAGGAAVAALVWLGRLPAARDRRLQAGGAGADLRGADAGRHADRVHAPDGRGWWPPCELPRAHLLPQPRPARPLLARSRTRSACPAAASCW